MPSLSKSSSSRVELPEENWPVVNIFSERASPSKTIFLHFSPFNLLSYSSSINIHTTILFHCHSGLCCSLVLFILDVLTRSPCPHPLVLNHNSNKKAQQDGRGPISLTKKSRKRSLLKPKISTQSLSTSLQHHLCVIYNNLVTCPR